MTQRLLSQADLAALVLELVAADTQVIAPVAIDGARVEYKSIKSIDEAAFNRKQAASSIKQYFLPRTEVLLAYKQTKDGVEIFETPTQAKPRVILGAPPCDVAALEVVDKVMNWDYRDELWNGRREATTIVSFACTMADASCFCTAVGLAPDAQRGSDVMLTQVEGGYLADVLTAKGEQLLSKFSGQTVSEAANAEAAKTHNDARAKVEANLEKLAPEFGAWLAQNFDNPTWEHIPMRCHGCGVCSSVCPTCHCFDVVDEHTSSQEGVRRRNWDTCQHRTFTVHASGHNPRPTQIARFRQRVMHKFSIYPSKFGEILCTGCGRCARACPGGMMISEVVGELHSLSQKAAEGKGE